MPLALSTPVQRLGVVVVHAVPEHVHRITHFRGAGFGRFQQRHIGFVFRVKFFAVQVEDQADGVGGRFGGLHVAVGDQRTKGRIGLVAQLFGNEANFPASIFGKPGIVPEGKRNGGLMHIGLLCNVFHGYTLT